MLLRYRDNYGTVLAVVLTVLAALYVIWKITQSPDQATQFAFNGLAVGAVYALIAMGFTLVYSTVWFFDLYYGAASALGAYGVFYLRSHDTLGGRYEVNEPVLNLVFAAVTVGVVVWAFHTAFEPRLRGRLNPTAIWVIAGLVGAAAGIYMWFVLSYPANIHVTLAPAVGVIVALLVVWVLHAAYRQLLPRASVVPVLVIGAVAGIALGVYCGLLVSDAPGSGLYLSWGVSCLLAGLVSLALYRGLYVHMREQARSTADNAGGDARHTAGDHRVHDDHLSERAATTAGHVWQRSVEDSGREHQGVQRIHGSGSGGGLRITLPVAQDDRFRQGCEGYRR